MLGRRRTFGGSLAALVLLSGTVLSCSQTAEQRYEAQLANTGEPALHAVHSQRLEEVMGRMNNIALERLPQEVDPDRVQADRAEQVAELAAALAETSDLLPETVPATGLSPAERELFVSLSHKLRDQSLDLKGKAQTANVDQMQQALDEITSTCNACHSAFRVAPAL